MSFSVSDDVALARLCQLLFLPVDRADIYCKAKFKNSFLEGCSLRNHYDIFTKNGGRIHYFPTIRDKLSIVVFCPIEGMQYTTSTHWELLPTENYGIKEIGGVQDVFYASPCGANGTAEKLLKRWLADDECTKIYTGLSFGGAMATSFSLRVPCDKLVVFGSLRAGNQELFDTVTKKVKTINCYVNPGDPVPHLPFHCGTFAKRIDPGDCKGHPANHRRVECHGNYLGVSFVKADVQSHTRNLIDKACEYLKI
jgi:hypothetical protein